MEDKMKKIIKWSIFLFLSAVCFFTVHGLTFNVSTKAELARLKGEISMAQFEWLIKLQSVLSIMLIVISILCLIFLVLSVINYVKISSKNK